MVAQNFSISILRPEDLLYLHLEFINVEFLSPQASDSPQIVLGLEQNSYLIVQFPPQHIAEEAFYRRKTGFEITNDKDKDYIKPGDPKPPLPGIAAIGEVETRIATPSRIAFRIPHNQRIEYTTQGLLNAIESLPLSVAQSASFELTTQQGCTLIIKSILEKFVPWLRFPGLDVPLPPLQAPAKTETKIEAPYRLVMSPNAQARWTNRPQETNDVINHELWYTQLINPTGNAPTMRAIWSPDMRLDNKHQPVTQYPVTGANLNKPFRMSLDPRDRHQMVNLTSNFHIAGFKPQPVNVSRLLLSSLGAWLNYDGKWTPPANLSIEEWRHEAVMARDQYVKVVYAGYLFPFGHRASLVKITERELMEDPQAAYLLQRMFIIIREPVRQYPLPNQTGAGRDLPFQSIHILTQVTPDIDDPNSTDILGKGQQAFWPSVASEDFHFKIEATDKDGNVVRFAVPLVFVEKTLHENFSPLSQVIMAYNNENKPERRITELQGQALSFVKSNDTDGAVFCQSLEFKGQLHTTASTHSSYLASLLPPPAFFPILEKAKIVDKAAQQLLQEGQALSIVYHNDYVKNGFAGSNTAEVYARIESGKPVLDFQVGGKTERAGGLGNPRFEISGLTRKLGLVPDVGQAIGGEYKANSIFNGAFILGDVPLSNIIAKGSVTKQAPKLVVEDSITASSVTNGQKTHLSWNPKLQNYTFSIFTLDTTGSTLQIDTYIEQSASGGVTYSAEGAFLNFKTIFANTMSMHFEALRFKVVDGKKPDIEPQFDTQTGLKFIGDLSFVEEIRKVIPIEGFVDPPSLDVTADGIIASYTLAIPTVAMGAFTLQNLALTGGFHLPLLGDGLQGTSVNFAISERQNPFIITVSAFGGGGFFAIELTTKGVKTLEVALEFGGSIALNLGVASGGVVIMAGIYFALHQDTSTSLLSGYLRAGGALQVLGIVTVSVEFYLEFSYDNTGAASGSATVTVKVSVAFLKKSVSLTCKRQFAGSSTGAQAFSALAATTANDFMTQDEWKSYSEAFAAY